MPHCTGSVEAQSLDRPGSPHIFVFNVPHTWTLRRQNSDSALGWKLWAQRSFLDSSLLCLEQTPACRGSPAHAWRNELHCISICQIELCFHPQVYTARKKRKERVASGSLYTHHGVFSLLPTWGGRAAAEWELGQSPSGLGQWCSGVPTLRVMPTLSSLGFEFPRHAETWAWRKHGY